MKWILVFPVAKVIPVRGSCCSLPLSIDYEVLFSDVPCVWLRKDHPALHEAWNLDTFLRYPHISICWEQSDTWALDNVLQELGANARLL